MYWKMTAKDDDACPSWGARKFWGMKRWIWILIGIGVCCAMLAVLAYFVGSMGGKGRRGW